MMASNYMCAACKKQPAAAFWPGIDPDIKAFPYCRKCLDEAQRRVLDMAERMGREHARRGA